jgi:hypothetical protein
MPRTPLTEEQKKARVAKAAATRAAKQKAAMKELGLKPRKKVRKGKVMSAEQKAAAAERLRKAREAKGPSQNNQIAEEVRNLPDEDVFSVKNVRQWIKTNKELLHSIRDMKDSKEAKEREQYNNVEGYLANLQSYLRSGVYLDMFYGEHRQSKVKHRCVRMAYYPDGTPKRTVGVWYPDIGVYTEEMARNGREAVSNKKQVRKAG